MYLVIKEKERKPFLTKPGYIQKQTPMPKNISLTFPIGF